jgi:hypothetical protein
MAPNRRNRKNTSKKQAVSIDESANVAQEAPVPKTMEEVYAEQASKLNNAERQYFAYMKASNEQLVIMNNCREVMMSIKDEFTQSKLRDLETAKNSAKSASEKLSDKLQAAKEARSPKDKSKKNTSKKAMSKEEKADLEAQAAALLKKLTGEDDEDEDEDEEDEDEDEDDNDEEDDEEEVAE